MAKNQPLVVTLMLMALLSAPFAASTELGPSRSPARSQARPSQPDSPKPVRGGEPMPPLEIVVEGADCVQQGVPLDVVVSVRRHLPLATELEETPATLVVLSSPDLGAVSVSGARSRAPAVEVEELMASLPPALIGLQNSRRTSLYYGDVWQLANGLSWQIRQPASSSDVSSPLTFVLRVPGVGEFWKELPACAASSAETTGAPPLVPLENRSPRGSAEPSACGGTDLELPTRDLDKAAARNQQVADAETVRATAGTIDVNLTLYYRDDGGSARVLRFAEVELWDDDTIGDDLLASGLTDGDGLVSFTGISNSDVSGGVDAYFKIFLVNSAVDVTSGGDATYSWTTSTQSNLSDGTYWWAATLETNAGACNIFDSLVKGWQSVAGYADPNPGQVAVTWPDNDTDSTSYYWDGRIHLEGSGQGEPDEWDESVHLHEYGHFIDDRYAGLFTPDYGSDGGHSWSSHEDGKTAWGEGWANFLQSAVRSFWGYASPERYIETTWSVSLESDAHWPGWSMDDAEGAISATLWDVFDSASDTGDTLSRGFDETWAVFDAGTGNETIADYWNGWVARSYGNLPELSEILYEHGCYAVVGDLSSPSVIITSPTSSSTYSTSSRYLSLGGSASDNLHVSLVTWSNNRGGGGTASGTNSWSVSNIYLYDGSNGITVTASDRKGNTSSDTLSVTYTATHTLTVARSGDGTGTVTSNPAGINCGSDCSQSYTDGTSVTLTASPTVGSHFEGWSGSCSGTGTCTVIMTSSRSVVATFGTSAPVLIFSDDFESGLGGWSTVVGAGLR